MEARTASPPSARFERMVPATAEAVGPLRRALRRFAREHGAAPAAQAAIALAFSEACADVIQYAYSGRRAAGPLILQARVGDGRLVVRVTDAGSTRRVLDGGFGRQLIAELAERYSVRPRHGTAGTVRTMVFALEGVRRSSPQRPYRSSTRR
jgi:anti-sigma regulatory factor (Ser/Thr protein kinase)